MQRRILALGAPGDPRTAAAPALVLMAAGLLAGSSPAAASEILGGISWRCVKDADTTIGIDMDLACIIQYGGAARAGLAFWWDPYSWYCLQ